MQRTPPTRLVDCRMGWAGTKPHPLMRGEEAAARRHKADGRRDVASVSLSEDAKGRTRVSPLCIFARLDFCTIFAFFFFCGGGRGRGGGGGGGAVGRREARGGLRGKKRTTRC